MSEPAHTSRTTQPADTTAPSLKPYIIAVAAVALWAALRLLPADITPEAPETMLRHAVRATASPQRRWKQPQPFPSYEPGVAYSLLDHLSEAEVTQRRPSDPEALRREIDRLRSRVSTRWLSASGYWRVAGEGVLTCFTRPSEPTWLAAALRAPPPQPPLRVAVRTRFFTPPEIEERIGLTPGLDRVGSGPALLVGFPTPDTLACEMVRLERYQVAEVLSRREVPVPSFPPDEPGPWLDLDLVWSGGTWKATVDGFASLEASAPAPVDGRPGVLLRSEGTRAAFFGFALDGRSVDVGLDDELARLAEELRLAELLASPGDMTFQFSPDSPSQVREVTLNGVTRRAIVTAVPGSLRFDLPAWSGQARFETWVGIHPVAWSRAKSFSTPESLTKPVLVEIALETALGTRVLRSNVLDPTDAAARGWVSVDVPVAGGSTLVLRARGTTQATNGDRVPGGYLVWGNPVVRLPRGADHRLNLVMIVIDSLRADALHALHPRGVQTPGLEQLAAEGVLFEHAYSQAPWFIPSLATLHSSLWPEVHGTDPRDFRMPGSLSPAATTLAEALRRKGYRTAWVSEVPPPGRVNLEQGFEEVVTVPGEAGGRPARLYEHAYKWASSQPMPFFLFIRSHRLSRVVGSVRSGPPQDLDQLRKELRRRYRGEVEELDRELAGFMKSLGAGKLLEECLVVVLGGHGTDLCDRYPTIVTGGPGFTLRDEQLHVPLIIRPPKRFGWSRRVSTQVRLIDLGPTLCDLLSIPVSEQWQGASLAPAIRQGQGLDELPVFASACNLEPDRAAVRYHRHKYIRVLRPAEPRGRIFLEPLPSEQLYNVRQDPGETENLATRAPQRLANMQRMLLQHLKESQAERERLFPELPRPPEDASEEPPALKQPGKSTPISETAP